MERIQYAKWKYAVMELFCALGAVVLGWLVYGRRYGDLFRPLAGWVGIAIGWGVVSLISLRIGMPKPAEGGGWKRLSDAIIVLGGTAILAVDAYWLYQKPLWLSTWLLTGLVLLCAVQLLAPRWRNSSSPLLYGSAMAAMLAVVAVYLLVVHPLTTAQAEARLREQGYQTPYYRYFSYLETSRVGCYGFYAEKDGVQYHLLVDPLDGAVLLAEPNHIGGAGI